MRFMIIILMCINTLIAERTITFPHTEDFSESDCLDDITWEGAGTGADVSRVMESWRDNNYCAKIIPPNLEGQNYSALGKFNFTATDTLNIAFAINIGTTYNSTAATYGGNTQNKFLDVHNGGDRIGILCLNQDTDYEWALWNGGTSVQTYYDGDLTGGTNSGNANAVSYSNGSAGDNDYAGDWLWVNYILTQDTSKIYIWDQSGTLSGLYFQNVNNATANPADFYIGGYYNGYHPSYDSNTYILIDDLQIRDNNTSQSPPSGFLTSEEEVASQKKTDTINVEEN